METIQSDNLRILHFCNICKSKPDQLSHHKSHLTTQKHIYKKKCYELCVKDYFSDIYNFYQCNDDTDNRRKNILELFEKDKGFYFVQGDRLSHDNLLDWYINKNILLDEEFKNNIIPLETFFETEELYKNSIEQIIKVNETVTISNKKLLCINKNKNIIDKIISNIEEYDIDFFINMIVGEQEPHVVALIMYKLNYIDNHHKKMNKNIKYNNTSWIYKDNNNKNINSMNICINFKNINFKNIILFFEQKMEEYTKTSNEYMALTKITNKLKINSLTPRFKNDVINIAEYIYTINTD
jgi:hypothetical protein